MPPSFLSDVALRYDDRSKRSGETDENQHLQYLELFKNNYERCRAEPRSRARTPQSLGTLVMKLADLLRRLGHEVEIESDGADLAVHHADKRIAIEIETGKSEIEANPRRDLESNFNQVIVVGPTRSLRLADLLNALTLPVS